MESCQIFFPIYTSLSTLGCRQKKLWMSYLVRKICSLTMHT
eukprot:UN03824